MKQILIIFITLFLSASCSNTPKAKPIEGKFVHIVMIWLKDSENKEIRDHFEEAPHEIGGFFQGLQDALRITGYEHRGFREDGELVIWVHILEFIRLCPKQFGQIGRFKADMGQHGLQAG